MKRWERNIRALAQRNWQTAAVLEQRILKDNAYSIQAEKLNDNTSILKLSKDGYQWRLNSCLDPQTASKLYADQYQVKPFYRYFIFGFSDGRIIRQLLEKCDDSNLLLIYEPDKEIFAQAVLQYDLEDLFLDHRVWIGIPETWEQLENLVAGVVEFGILLGEVDVAVGAVHVAVVEEPLAEVEFGDCLAFGRLDIEDSRLNLVVDVFVLIAGSAVEVAEDRGNHGLCAEVYVVAFEELVEYCGFLLVGELVFLVESQGVLVGVGVARGNLHHRVAICSGEEGVLVVEVSHKVVGEVGEETDAEVVPFSFPFGGGL